MGRLSPHSSSAWPDEPALIGQLRAAPRPSVLEPAEIGLAFVCLFLFSQGVIGPVFADPADTESSAILRLIWLPVYGLTLAVMMLRPGPVLAVLARNGLILSLAGLALASALWSLDGETTIRRGFALVMTTAFGLWLASRLSWRGLVMLFASVFAVLALLSAVFALALPQIGVDQDVHAGAWRGVWLEKNTLGAMMAWGSIACWAAALADPRRFTLWAGLALFCGLLVFLSTSKTALLAWLLGSCGAIGIALARRGFGFAALMIFGLATGLSGIVLIGLLAPVQALEALGRDATLTGRTEIWAALIEAIGAAPWTGYGYMAFWTADDGPVFWLRQATAWDVPTAHNGWIETALAIGVPGALLMALIYLQALMRAFARLFAGPETYWALCFLAVFGLVSLTESNLLEQNGLSWVLFTATAAKLAMKR